MSIGIAERIDQAQQRRKAPSIALATLKKYSEDHTGNYAGLIAFWAFFSIFPLFLVFITLLGFFLPSSAKTEVLTSVARLFPLLHPQTLKGLSGAWWPLILGAAAALWSGMKVLRGVQFSFNSIWEIQEKDRPGMLEKTARSIVALVIIGGGLVLTTLVSGIAIGNQSSVHMTWYYRAAGYAFSLGADVGIFMIAFRLLTSRRVSFRDVRAGALLAGTAFFVLQQVSSLVISHYLGKAQSTYGSFAVVITMLWWFNLEAQIMLLGAQLNVVLTERLHPRSIVGGPETEADRRVLEAYADQQTYHEQEDIDARIEQRPTGTPRRAA